MGTLTCEPWPNSSLLKRRREAPGEFAQRNAGNHAEENPNRQISLKEGEDCFPVCGALDIEHVVPLRQDAFGEMAAARIAGARMRTLVSL